MADPARASLSISASVGRGGVNIPADVVIVQGLINQRLPAGIAPLDPDGKCGPLTCDAIEAVQRTFLQMQSPDGRVDPGGRTFLFLTGGTPASGPGVFPADVVSAAQASHVTWTIPASITLAQWALESSWGRHMPPGSNNPFGIKAREGQPFVESSTREVINGESVTIVARFRQFASIAEAFDLHGRLLATAAPYAHARTLVNDPNAFADALTGVYATDPHYGESLRGLMAAHNLFQFD